LLPPWLPEPRLSPDSEDVEEEIEECLWTRLFILLLVVPIFLLSVE